MAEEKRKNPANADAATKKSWIYSVGAVAAGVLFKTFLPVRYHHAERLNVEGPFIVMSNHLSLMDPVIVGVAVRKRQIRFIGKKELWKYKPVAAIINSMHMIPVDRHNSDMEAMRACMRVTREGGILGIFPEGTRSKKGLMEELESGVGLIAMRSRVPLIPVYITGKVRLFRKLDVYVGEPIPMEDLRAEGINAETCAQLLSRITEVYAEMKETHTKA